MNSFSTNIKVEILNYRWNKLQLTDLLLFFLSTCIKKNSQQKFIMNLKFDEIAKFIKKNELLIVKNVFNKFEVNGDAVSIPKENFFEIDHFVKICNLKKNDVTQFRSILAGLFLASGSVNDPKKTKYYHLQMILENEVLAKAIYQILKSKDYGFNFFKRGKKFVLYLKKAKHIADFLRIIGANKFSFYFDEIIIEKDFTSSIKRSNNINIVNIEKISTSTINFLQAVDWLMENNKLFLLDKKIVDYIKLRKQNIHLSLNELSILYLEKYNLSISKSALNHWNRKINSLYKKYKEQE